MGKRRQDIYSGLFFIALAIVYFIGTYTIKLYSAFDVIVLSSASIPRVLAVILFISGTVLVASNLRALKNEKTSKQAQPDAHSSAKKAEDSVLDVDKELAEAEKNEESNRYNYKDIVLTVIFLVIYLIAMENIGFIAATFIYLVAQIILMTKKTERKKKAPFTLILSAVAAVGIYYLFSSVLGLILPTGLLEF